MRGKRYYTTKNNVKHKSLIPGEKYLYRTKDTSLENNCLVDSQTQKRK